MIKGGNLMSNTLDKPELLRVCTNCHCSFPSEPFGSNFAICLNDPEFEPYLDEILENQDFSRCQELVDQKRFSWEQEACPDFDPVEDIDEDFPLSPELSGVIERLAKAGHLTTETLEQAVLEDIIDKIDWANVPVDRYVENLNNARTLEAREKAVRSLGGLISLGNRAAFDALCSFLKDLPPPTTVGQTHLRVSILRELSHAYDYWEDLAYLLVEDLFRTPSNNTTRSWYTAVFRFCEGLPVDVAEKALSPMLASPRFSYRIKKRVRVILALVNDRPLEYW